VCNRQAVPWFASRRLGGVGPRRRVGRSIHFREPPRPGGTADAACFGGEVLCVCLIMMMTIYLLRADVVLRGVLYAFVPCGVVCDRWIGREGSLPRGEGGHVPALLCCTLQYSALLFRLNE
jgi:hypothetical protein